jgi:phage recombination protein Bet
MSNMITVQINQLAKRFELPESEELYTVLKATAFKGDVSDAQLSALLIVAKQYGLNPWIKQIYAFPDKNNGIVPVVGVDGWTHIINSHPQYDGVEFEQDDTRCTCIIYRKDRTHATKVTEYMVECRRDAGPWKSHPYRMLRHKALIQCARLAFGFSGIYDSDEAERIMEAQQSETKVINPNTGEITATPKVLPDYTDEAFAKNLPIWRNLIESGKKTADQILRNVALVAIMSEEQKAMVLATESNIIDMEQQA